MLATTIAGVTKISRQVKCTTLYPARRNTRSRWNWSRISFGVEYLPRPSTSAIVWYFRQKKSTQNRCLRSTSIPACSSAGSSP